MKHFLQYIIKWLVYSNIWVGVAVASLSYISLAHWYHINLDIILICGAATTAAYNYMRLVQLRTYSPGSGEYKLWVKQNPYVIAMLTSSFGALALFVFLRDMRLDLLYLLLPVGFISLIYPLSFRSPFSGFTSLRQLAGIKLFLIAFSWAYVTVLVPAVAHGIFGTELLIELLLRICLIIALIIPFDIRDMDHDDPKMRTIPQIVGLENARELSIFFLLLYQMWLVVRFFIFDFPWPVALGIFAGIEIAYFLFIRISKNRSAMFYSFWIEGVPVIIALLVLLFQWLFQAAV